MADRLTVHIGEPKTGTTFVQQMLHQHRDVLQAHDLDVVGSRKLQIRACQQAMHVARVGGGRQELDVGHFRKLRETFHALPTSSAVISMESLVRATPAAASLFLQVLDPAEVTVLVTARDLGSVLPAQWQESLQFRHAWSWDAYLSDVLADHARKEGGGEQFHSSPADNFWSQHDLPRFALTWSRFVGKENVHVITVPPRGSSDSLWLRVTDILGFDGSGCAAVSQSNESLGTASAEVLRQVNVNLAQSPLSMRDYSRVVKDYVSKRVLSRRKHLEVPAAIPERYWDRVLSVTADVIDETSQMGIPLHGSWDELRPTTPSPSSPATSAPSAEESLAAAVDALTALLGEHAAILTELDDCRDRRDEIHLEAERAVARADDADEALARLHEQHRRTLARLRDEHRSSLDRLRQEYETSRSWRLTAPVRRAGSLMRGDPHH